MRKNGKYGGILGLTGTVGGNSGITGLVCHLDGLPRLGYGSDLVQFDQNGVTTAKGCLLYTSSIMWFSLA